VGGGWRGKEETEDEMASAQLTPPPAPAFPFSLFRRPLGRTACTS
jgi:hypothetical protein